MSDIPIAGVRIVDFQVRPGGGLPVAILETPDQDLALDLVRDDIAGAALAEEFGLETAVLASLFTWRRADPDDVLPFGADRKGAWVDAYPVVDGDQWGSRLWLLVGRVLTDRDVALARSYAEQALKWLVDDSIADRVEVRASRSADPVRLNIGIRIVRGDRELLNRRFVGLWDQMEILGNA